MNVGFALCGSFCTYQHIFPVMESLSKKHRVIPIFSFAAQSVDSRFGTAEEHLQKARDICSCTPIQTMEAAEPIGPKHMLDALIIAPCTGNTLAKLAHGIADTSVTMAAKSHLRNGRPILVAISTNDALAGAAENVGRLMGRKHYYFVPFGQDDPTGKPASMIADFGQIPTALEAALKGEQIQPILL